jgi:hypothetical protein
VPSRMLIILQDHWPRAMLCAALQEHGYDAVGVPTLGEAISTPITDSSRGPVSLVILDQNTVPESETALLRQLLAQHPDARWLLLASALKPPLPGPWQRVLRHPIAIGEIVRTAEALLPLQPS